MLKEHISLKEALASLPAGKGIHFAELFSLGGIEVEIYAPKGKDLQQPHTRDELYFVATGEGMFVNGNNRHSFGPGDMLFVPAGIVHRFEDFTDDFVVWVVFFGPEGGHTMETSNAVR